MYRTQFSALVDAAGVENRSDMLELVNLFIESCKDYTKMLNTLPVQLTIARVNIEDVQEYQRFIIGLDTRRRNVHNVIISSVRNLNRLCLMFGCECIFCEIPDDDSRDDVYRIIAERIAEEFKEESLSA